MDANRAAKEIITNPFTKSAGEGKITAEGE
jgi:hypothetical protein